MPAIEVQNLTKYFGEVKAVDGISFSVESGETFGFLGPNGAGKTTTIRCMMDFIRPTSGRVSILGLDSFDDACELKKSIGYLAGSVRLYDNWTGDQHIAFALGLRDGANSARSLASRLKLDTKTKAKNLSSGNRQKLAILLAFMSDPKVIILDEPTMALDPLMQNVVYEIIRERTAKGATVFLSSHNLSEVERICGRVGIIRQGKMVAVESIETLKSKQVHKVRAAFATANGLEKLGHLEKVEIQNVSQNVITMNVRGDLSAVLQILAQNQLESLEIRQASLEDIFLEYYEK